MATLRDLKGRIGSVSSSEKITGAMKMISSAKMNKATREIKRLLPFRTQLETIIGNLLGADAEFASPLTEVRPEVRHVSVVVLGSDDGLCGAYNVNILKGMVTQLAQIENQYPDARIAIYPVGAKMAKAASRITDGRVEVRSSQVNSKSDADAVKAFTTDLRTSFLSGETDLVYVIYMKFISAGRQRLTTLQLLPVEPDSVEQKEAAAPGMYIFEPDAQTIFNTALPLMLLSTMQEVFSENRASEQAARVMAMQSANDNASKLLEELQLEYNKLRQQSITAELLDILGGQVR